MEKKRLGFWDYLLWGGAIIILVWALLKMFGIIQTPAWVNAIPIAAGALSLFGVAYKVGKIMQEIEHTNNKVDNIFEIKNNVQKIKNNQMNCLTGKLRGSPYSFKMKG